MTSQIRQNYKHTINACYIGYITQAVVNNFAPVSYTHLDVYKRQSLDGERLPHYLHRRKFEEAEAGWYYSQTKKSVQIKYRNPRKDYDVVISFEEFDMIGM